jgi:hypothetical protein
LTKFGTFAAEKAPIKRVFGVFGCRQKWDHI